MIPGAPGPWDPIFEVCLPQQVIIKNQKKILVSLLLCLILKLCTKKECFAPLLADNLVRCPNLFMLRSFSAANSRGYVWRSLSNLLRIRLVADQSLPSAKAGTVTVRPNINAWTARASWRSVTKLLRCAYRQAFHLILPMP